MVSDALRVADGDRALVNQAPAGLGASRFDPSRSGKRAIRCAPMPSHELISSIATVTAGPVSGNPQRAYAACEQAARRGHLAGYHECLANAEVPWALVRSLLNAVERLTQPITAHDARLAMTQLPERAKLVWSVMDGAEGIAFIRDSDGSPKGGDACGSVHESAVGNADAPNTQVSETPSDTLGEKA